MANLSSGRGTTTQTRRLAPLLWVGLALAVVGAIFAFVVFQRRHDRDEGIRLALAGELAAAEPLLSQALERDPEDAEVLRALTLGRMTAGKLTEAEEPLNRWRTLRPGETEPHLAAVDLAVRRGNLPAASDAAGTVLELQPDTHDLRQRRAVWLLLIGRTEKADAECRWLRERRPDDQTLILLEAEICLRLGDLARAGPLVDGLLRTDPRLAPALVLRGALDLDAGHPDRAVDSLRQALEKPGEHQRRARHFLSLALARTGRETEARRLLIEERQHQEVDLWEKYGRSDSVGYKVAIAEALVANGKSGEAVRLLERAVAQSPDCVAAHRILAEIYETQGKTDLASRHRHKANK